MLFGKLGAGLTFIDVISTDLQHKFDVLSYECRMPSVTIDHVATSLWIGGSPDHIAAISDAIACTAIAGVRTPFGPVIDVTLGITTLEVVPNVKVPFGILLPKAGMSIGTSETDTQHNLRTWYGISLR
jgi:hypothetical protein